jgi:hypothetical protein
MVEIEFIYNGNTTLFQANYSDQFKDIVQKLHLKLDFDINKVYYLYNGKTIENKNLTIFEIIKSIDKESNKMAIQIIDQEKVGENNLIVNSPQVICPQCKSIARMNINDYRIRIYDCINKHDIKDILLENYEKTQKINLTEIICDECKIKNKGNSYRNIFYRCNTCKKNLCPLCKDRHEQHNIINHDDINYICQEHNYPFALYCNTCKNNICILCEKEHGMHYTISYGKIVPNKENIKNDLVELRKKWIYLIKK